jgi:hypothetical protein
MLTSIGGAEVGKFILGGTALWFTQEMKIQIIT